MKEIKFKDIQAIEGWLLDDEIKFLQEQGKKGGLIVEIGAWKGKSTVALASSGNKIVSIDHHVGSIEHQRKEKNIWTFPVFRENIKRFELEEIVIPIVAKSENVDFINDIDFLFIDGDHVEAGAMKDLIKWVPKVKDSGTVMMHDFYNKTPCGATSALTEYLKTSDFKLIDRVGSSAILKKQ